MRIVIIGGGEIGFALAQSLSVNHEVYVVDHVPDVADRFEPLDVQFLLGAATSAICWCAPAPRVPAWWWPAPASMR